MEGYIRTYIRKYTDACMHIPTYVCPYLFNHDCQMQNHVYHSIHKIINTLYVCS